MSNQNDRFDLRLDGLLTNLSPITIVPPNAEQRTTGDGKGKFSRVARRTINANGLRDERPVLTASTLRGKLRRAAVGIMREADRANGNSGILTLSQAHLNLVGGIKGAEKEEGFDILRRAALREKNPVLALFGGSDPWMMSRAMIGDGVPTEPVECDIIGHVRSDDASRDPDFFDKVDEAAAAQWSNLRNANRLRTGRKDEEKRIKSQIVAARKAKDTSLVERLTAELDDLRATGKEDTANAVSMPLTHECIPVGVEFTHRIILRGVTRAEAGLFLLAMAYFWREMPNVGQQASKGYGLMEGSYTVAYRAESDRSAQGALRLDGGQWTSAGGLELYPGEGVFNEVAEWVSETIDVFNEASSAQLFDIRQMAGDGGVVDADA